MSIPASTIARIQSRQTLSSIVTYGLLVSAAAVGWWWVIRMGNSGMGAARMSSMTSSQVAMSFGAFLVAWTAMMAAMMFPAASPVVAMFRRAAATGRVAPTPIFVLGYLIVWTAPGIPVYFAWRALMLPLADGARWTAWLAAGALVAAGVWQLTPSKSSCLRFCRSPLTFFLRFGKNLDSLSGAFRAGVLHGGFCFGCCWALMTVLVAVGSMNLEWMAGIAVLISIEKTITANGYVVRGIAAALGGTGVALFVHPALIGTIT
jgi:predicted metal-binding membrane protein